MPARSSMPPLLAKAFCMSTITSAVRSSSISRDSGRAGKTCFMPLRNRPVASHTLVLICLCFQRLTDPPKVGRDRRRGPHARLAEPLDSDPGHEAGERGKASLFRMGGHPGQLEHLVRHPGIKLRFGDLNPLFASGLGESAAQGVEPGIHLDAKLSLTELTTVRTAR